MKMNNFLINPDFNLYAHLLNNNIHAPTILSLSWDMFGKPSRWDIYLFEHRERVYAEYLKQNDDMYSAALELYRNCQINSLAAADICQFVSDSYR